MSVRCSFLKMALHLFAYRFNCSVCPQSFGVDTKKPNGWFSIWRPKDSNPCYRRERAVS